jgi:catechol 2,3-dioxygenase-like lactoylglutathione lyase family enzyme
VLCKAHGLRCEEGTVMSGKQDPHEKGFVPVRGLHHFAYRCRDAEETRQFYEDLLGLRLAHLIQEDHVPSTGEYCPYVHIFFEMADGSFIAFFDLGDDLASEPSPNTPSWVNHLALNVESAQKLREAKQRLEAAGIEVVGITDHGFINSIYFFDPNGIRLELTVQVQQTRHDPAALQQTRARLDAWSARKDALRASGQIKAGGQSIIRSHSHPAYR